MKRVKAQAVIGLVCLSFVVGCSKLSNHTTRGEDLGTKGNAMRMFSLLGATSHQTQGYNRKYSIPTDLGAVFWSGHFDNPVPGSHRLPEGMKALGYLGFSNVRIVLAPNALGADTYDVQGVSCPVDDYLSCLANQPDYKTAMAEPRVSIVALVTYDAFTLGLDGNSRRYAQSDYLNANASGLVDTYKNLTLTLYRNYSGSGKTFVITAWEADNALYCGSAWAFDINMADNPSPGQNFRDWCLANYQSIYGVSDPSQAYAGYSRWMDLRQQGITAGRQAAQQLGYADVEVLGAMEFNTVNLVHQLGYPTALYNIAGQSNLDFVTYSSYESINNNTLLQDADTIYSRLGSKAFAVSEFGFSPDSIGDGAAKQRTSDTIRQIASLHDNGKVLYGTAWQAFRDSANPNFGLITSGGAETDIFKAYIDGAGIQENPNAIPELPPQVENAGGGCNGCDCAWILGDEMPNPENLEVAIRDKDWNILTILDGGDPNLSRASTHVLTMVIPESLRSKFYSEGLRFTVVNKTAAGWWNTTDIRTCQ